MAYNSAHKGSQIDSAVSAVLQKEAIWDAKANALTFIATIGTGWVENEDTGIKSQSVAIDGVLAKHTAKVDHAYTGDGTSDSYSTFVEEENQYLNYITNGYAETYDGGITFYIFGDVNTVTIPIVVEVT